MPFEPDWSKIFKHHSVTDQFREYHRQIAPYLTITSEDEECLNATSQDEDHEKL